MKASNVLLVAFVMVMGSIVCTRKAQEEPTSSHGADAPEQAAQARAEDGHGLERDKLYALERVKVLNYRWRAEGGFLSVNLVISNGCPWSVKDLEILCQHSGESGTKIDSNRRTIYKVVPPFGVLTMQDFAMGFIHSQAARSSAVVVGFEFEGPHPTLEELSLVVESQRERMKMEAEQNKQREAQRKEQVKSAAVRYYSQRANEGEVFSQFRLGEIYLRGDSVEKDVKKAREWLEKAAAQGHEGAKKLLAEMGTTRAGDEL